MSINAIIVDDEEYSRKSLYFLIDGYCPEVKIKGIAQSVAEARKMLKSGDIDLVFLDIAMPHEDGFNLLPDLQEANSYVIFTTAFDQYALKALKASAVDYILKPIDIEELKYAVVKVINLKSQNGNDNSNAESKKAQLNSLEENLSDIKKINKINLPNSNGFQILNVNQIVYVLADSNYSIFHLENKESIIVSRHLKEYEEILENSGFSRIHKSTIINLKHLSDYTNKNGLTVKLSDNSEHVVSRRRSSEFLETVRNYFRR
ncbi:two-component system, LytT family, response regulator [Daejeonella rubra]|uniref:Two-component system, LytT family, response regulator n=1 Tax=Daejeonella rubra TaxID=990371 RepID=A0A1G9LXN2_9SPHI|nr:LytTR family DNA-binding domain-containing protein [Daejeonella rubra]SDL66686.1 two-component system, LytT family, response regulator [Daejeonella rubra]